MSHQHHVTSELLQSHETCIWSFTSRLSSSLTSYFFSVCSCRCCNHLPLMWFVCLTGHAGDQWVSWMSCTANEEDRRKMSELLSELNEFCQHGCETLIKDSSLILSRLWSLPQWDSCVILTQQWLGILLFEPGYSAQFKLLVIITSVTDMTFTAHWSIWPSPNNHQRQSESGKIWSLLIHHHHHKLLQTWKTATRGANTRLFPSGIYNGHQSF